MEWADTSCGVKLLDPAFEEEDAKRKQWERGRGLSHAPITDVGERFGGAVAFMRSGLIPWLSGRKGGIDYDAFEDEVENEWEQSMLEYVCSRCDSAMAIRCLSDGTNSGSVRFDSQHRVRWQRSCVFGKWNAALDIQEWWRGVGRRRAEQETRAKRAWITCQVARARCRLEEAAALRRIDAAIKIERCWRRHIQKRRAQCDAALVLARAEMSEQVISAPAFFI